jgi:chromosome segregation ATPase
MIGEDSDEVTSAENTPCCECFENLEDFGNRRGSFHEGLCEKCWEMVRELERDLKFRIDQIHQENSELTSTSIKKMQESHHLQTKIISNSENFLKIEDLNRKSRFLQRDFSDTFSILLSLEKEKSQVSQKLNENQCKLEKTCEKIKFLQICLKSPAEDLGTLEDLRIENSSLLNQVKDKEINNFLEIKSTFEALSTLKNQFLREKRMGLRSLSGEIRNLQLLTEIEKSLMEELQDVKRKIEIL